MASTVLPLPGLSTHPVSAPERAVVLIMAGGVGTRLWPLSYPQRPKQFAPLFEENLSLLQATFARTVGWVPGERVFVSVTAATAHLVRSQLPKLPAANIIVIPGNRDTLPSLAYAAAHIATIMPHATLVMLASDNIVDDVPALHRSFDTMLIAAQSAPNLVSLGIRPTGANTAYGYMHRGAPTPYGAAAAFGLGYVEKPDLAMAQKLFSGGQHDWNSGMFAWDIETFFAAIGAVNSEVAVELTHIRDALWRHDTSAAERAFLRMPSLSVDHGLLEHIGMSTNISSVSSAPSTGRAPAVRQVFVTGDFTWDDVGNFASLGRYWRLDDAANHVRGTVFSAHSGGNLLMASPGYTLHIDGLHGLLVVVGTAGDILVADKNRTGDVSRLNQQSFFTGLTKFGELPRPQAMDRMGNRATGLCRLFEARHCTVVNPNRTIVGLLGVTGIIVTISGNHVTVQREAARVVSAGRGASPVVQVYEDAETVADHVASQIVEDLRTILSRQLHPAITLSAGQTPLGVYARLVQRYARALDWSRILFFQMDEYTGLTDADSRRFSRMLQEALVQPLGMQGAYLTGCESTAQMQAYAQHIDDVGGLALVLHGVGTNGHLGFNEPGTPVRASARQTALAETTRTDLVARGHDAIAPTHGVTLGLQTLNAAQYVRVMAIGAHKADAIVRGLCAPMGDDSALSSLQTHPDIRIFADISAFSKVYR